MPPSIGRRLWKSAETYSKHQKTVDRAVKESEQQDKNAPTIRIAALVPASLEETVTAAAPGAQVCEEYLKYHLIVLFSDELYRNMKVSQLTRDIR